MKKKWLIIGVVALLIVGGLYVKGSAKNNSKFIEVKTASVEVGDIQSYLSTTATIKSKDSREYYGLQAKVSEVHVKVGDHVKAGDLLVTYETQDLNTTLRQAEIQYNNAVLQKQELVNQDKQINSKIKELEKEIKELEESNNPMEQAKIETLKQQKNSLQPVSKERLQQMENSVELAKLQVDSTKQRIKENKDRIVAENSGVVTEVTVVTGAMGNAMQPAVVIQDIENLKAVASVGRYDANSVIVGQQTIVRSGSEVLKGEILFVDPVAKRSMSTAGSETLLGIEIDILEKSGSLKVDFGVDVDILLGEAKETVKIPAESIRTDRDGRYYVFVVEDQQAKERDIVVGLQSDMEAQVVGGLEAGEVVILNPRSSIKEGTFVSEEVGGKGR